MTRDDALSVSRALMAGFARRTGLTSDEDPKRYLWTDAFAVCNYLGFYSHDRVEEDRRLAEQLIEQVHHTLGRHRPDDPRTGWISGLDERAGEAHPTVGGLRIGKARNERGPEEPFDDDLEWDRDGQYYHYLTRWMHALGRFGGMTGTPNVVRWGLELAEVAHARFTYTPPTGGRMRMYWKMSIDLSRPLVPSMGQHDPLDGFVTYQELQAAAARMGGEAAWPTLAMEAAELARVCEGQHWATYDALGIGGLLIDAFRVAQLTADGTFEPAGLLDQLLADAARSLAMYTDSHRDDRPAERRLAFRELGLSIGLAAAERLLQGPETEAGRSAADRARAAGIEALAPYVPLRRRIEAFWTMPEHQEAGSWHAHRDINSVMLATSLVPDGYLGI